MSNIIKSVTQVLVLQQVMIEILEQLPDDNIFVVRNKEQMKLIEANVEELTSIMDVKQSDNYIYICRNVHKVIDKIKGL
jgi:vacuolar-type H+-ATPase subunit E/Vma4